MLTSLARSKIFPAAILLVVLSAPPVNAEGGAPAATGTPASTGADPLDPNDMMAHASAQAKAIAEHAVQSMVDKKFDDASAVLNSALATPLADGDRRLLRVIQAEVEIEWGVALNNQGYASQAIEHFVAALPITKELNDQGDVALIETDLGQIYSTLGDYQKANDHLQQAISINIEMKDQKAESASESDLAFVLLKRGSKRDAYQLAAHALQIAKDINDRSDQANALSAMGLVKDAYGQVDPALDFLQQSLQIYKDLHDTSSAANALVDIAGIHAGLGRYDDAIRELHLALALNALAPNLHTKSALDTEAGAVYQELGQFREALRLLQEALSIDQSLDDVIGEQADLNTLSTVYMDEGDYENALDCSKRALDIATKQNATHDEVYDTITLAGVYSDLKQYDKALATYQEASKLNLQSGNLMTLGRVEDGIGTSLCFLGRVQDGLLHSTVALMLEIAAKDIRGEGHTLNNLMIDCAMLGLTRLGVFYGKEAVNLYQGMRSEIAEMDRAAQKSFLETLQATYRKLADLLIAEGDFVQAEQVLRMLKDQELSDFSGQNGGRAARHFDTIAYDPLEQRNDEEWHNLIKPLTAIVQQSDMTEQHVPLEEKKQINDAMDGLIKFELELFKQQTKPLSNRNMAPGELTPIQKELRGMPAGTIVVYSIVQPEQMRWVVATPAHETTKVIKISQKELRSEVRAWRRELSNPDGHPDELGKKLYNILVGPIAGDLEAAHATTIMWWLDDILHYAPMPALSDGHHYLVERYRSTIFTRSSLSWTNAAFANRKVLGMAVSKAHGKDFPALQGVQSEMNNIVHDGHHAGGLLPGLLLIDRDFTKSSMYANLNKGYSFVHIASHFLLGPNYATSLLLLGDGQTVSLQELLSRDHLFGSVNLLVLSACQTGVGALTSYGHEVESLGSVAQENGASGVLASLWSVADNSSPVLMKSFYQSLAGDKQHDHDKAKALQKAQLYLLHGDGKTPARYSHPYYWAPYILMGDWR